MCRNTVPTLRVIQDWEQDAFGNNYPTSYALQYQDKEGNWKNVPVVNRWPEPKQMELPLEDRTSS